MKCKSCGNELTQEMIDVNLCWSCGDIIDENFVEQSERSEQGESTHQSVMKSDGAKSAVNKGDNNGLENKNAIGLCLRILGIIVLFAGTISSFALADSGGRYHSFSFSLFLLYEFATVLSGFLLIGFGEIIQLLAKINSKLK